MTEKTVIGMATFEDRLSEAYFTIKSLAHQCDRMYVYVNSGHLKMRLPSNVTVFHAPDGDLGDTGKFYGLKECDDDTYYFTVDDDIFYPKNYINITLVKMQSFGFKHLYAYHGKRFHFPVSNYYYNKGRYFHFARGLQNDMKVHVLGTGVMAFHTALFKPDYKEMKPINMSDVHVAVSAEKNGIDRIVLSAPWKWIMPRSMKGRHNIHAASHKNCKVQTKLINQINWSKL